MHAALAHRTLAVLGRTLPVLTGGEMLDEIVRDADHWAGYADETLYAMVPAENPMALTVAQYDGCPVHGGNRSTFVGDLLHPYQWRCVLGGGRQSWTLFPPPLLPLPPLAFVGGRHRTLCLLKVPVLCSRCCGRFLLRFLLLHIAGFCRHVADPRTPRAPRPSGALLHNRQM